MSIDTETAARVAAGAVARLVTLALLAGLVVAVVLAATVAVVVLVGAFAIALRLALAVLAFLRLAAVLLFALRFGQQAEVVLGVLLEVLGRNAIVGQLSIARQLVVLVYDLLGRTADLAVRTGAVEHPVDDIAHVVVAVAVILGPRA